jgi:hypothetical protein
MLNKAHEAATNNGTAITTKRVSISDNPFEIFKLTTLYIIIKRISKELNFRYQNLSETERKLRMQDIKSTDDLFY